MLAKGLLEMVKELFTGLMERFSTPWWAEITTTKPKCIYYFGLFETSAEAKIACPSYIDDLDSEGVQGFFVIIKRTKARRVDDI